MSDSVDSSGTETAPRRKLGRGLSALMGEIRQNEPAYPAQGVAANEAGEGGGGPLRLIAVGAISPLPGQPRTHFDESSLDQLAASIAEHGVLQPIIVTEVGEGRYRLVAGERRWRAAQRAQLHEIPSLVRNISDEEIMALALIENIQREDLNPVEEARAYRRLADMGHVQGSIAAIVNKSRSHIANMMRLLELPEEVLDMLSSGKLTMGHARALVGHPRAAELATEAVQSGMSVRDMEKAARKGGSSAPSPKPSPSAEGNADILAVQGHLEDFLGMPVKISTEKSPQQGAVTIRYRTLDQLDLICQRLTGGDI